MSGKAWAASILFIFLMGVVAASHTPVSYYDPETRQNRPVWWIQKDPPSLFYSAERIEGISNNPLFVKANEGKLEQLHRITEVQKGTPYSWAGIRRLQGLQVIEQGEITSEEEAIPVSHSGVVGVVGNRFVWEPRHGVGQMHYKPVGLVGLLSGVFSEAKNERYRTRSTLYEKEVAKAGQHPSLR